MAKYKIGGKAKIVSVPFLSPRREKLYIGKEVEIVDVDVKLEGTPMDYQVHVLPAGTYLYVNGEDLAPIGPERSPLKEFGQYRFREGDKVQVIEDKKDEAIGWELGSWASALELGKIYTVEHVSGVEIQLKGYRYYVHSRHLKPAGPELSPLKEFGQYKFKVGDKIRVKEDAVICAGRYGTILNVPGGPFPYIVGLGKFEEYLCSERELELAGPEKSPLREFGRMPAWMSV